MIPPQLAPPIPEFIVDGILLHSEIRQAHLRRKNDNDGEWRGEGDTLDGWTVTSITDSAATLNKADKLITIELYPSAPP
jgi:hypothetical protein